jgi:hypothetical protein
MLMLQNFCQSLSRPLRGKYSSQIFPTQSLNEKYAEFSAGTLREVLEDKS